MGRVVPLTLEALDALGRPTELMDESCFYALSEFKHRQSRDAFKRLQAGGSAEIVGRASMDTLLTKLHHAVDPVLLEICALANINAFHSLPRLGGEDDRLVLERAITMRIHDLIDARPELLHPHLLIAEPSSAAQCMLPHLVSRKVILDPMRLQKLAQGPGGVSSLLQAAFHPAHGSGARNGGGRSLFAAALSANASCMDSATAIAISDTSPLASDPQELEALLLLCADALAVADAGAPWQLESAMRLYKAVGDRAEVQALAWPQLSELLTCNDLAWFSSRSLHPVIRFVYGVASQASSTAAPRRTELELQGWPQLQLARGVGAINACLTPSQQLHLDALSGEDLLKLMLLNPNASAAKTNSFWNLSTTERPLRNVWDLVVWAAGHRGAKGKRVQVSFLDKYQRDLASWMTPEHFQALRAVVIENTMKDSIAASGHAKGPAAAVAPPGPLDGDQGISAARRRSRAL